MVTLGVDLPSEKLSFGVASFDDFNFELLPPNEKLSLGGDSVGAGNLLLTGAGFSLLVVDWPKPVLFSFRGLSTGEESAGGESVEDGLFEEDIIAPIAVIIEGLNGL